MAFLDDDIVNLRRENGSTAQYYWGDEVNVLATDTKRHKVEVIGLNGPVDTGFILKKAKLRTTPLLRLSMIDVQQGDGLIIETPGGKVLFIDGGDNQLFARHAAARFRGTTEAKPLLVDLMLVTHGDADHFDGLNELRKSETHETKRKRILAHQFRHRPCAHGRRTGAGLHPFGQEGLERGLSVQGVGQRGGDVRPGGLENPGAGEGLSVLAGNCADPLEIGRSDSKFLLAGRHSGSVTGRSRPFGDLSSRLAHQRRTRHA